MAHDEPNAFVIDPGETKEMTWRMTESGEILLGCHQPGHYAAGMKGTIDIRYQKPEARSQIPEARYQKPDTRHCRLSAVG